MNRSTFRQCLRRAALLLVCGALAACADPKGDYKPEAGDVVFQSFPHSPLTDAIETASQSPYSHCGLVVRKGQGFAVLEAIGPVMETPLDLWIRRGRDQGFAAFRLKPEQAGKIDSFITAAYRFRGRPYDMHYDFDDEKIYCSELVFKAFRNATGEELGIVRKLGDLQWKPVEKFIRVLEGGKLPLDRPMITPKDLSEAPQLQLLVKKDI